MEKLTKGIIITLSILVVLTLVSYVLPYSIHNMECYNEIAEQVCEEEDMLLGYGVELSPLDSTDFTCIKNKENPREIGFDDFRRFRLLLEDRKKCSKRYQYWKRTW